MLKELAPKLRKRLGGLEKAKDVNYWVIENEKKAESFLDFYDSLVKKINAIPNGHAILKITPATNRIKNLLGDAGVPQSRDYMDMEGTKGTRLLIKAINEASGPMMAGQDIKSKINNNPSPEDKEYAIGTPSMETTSEALAFGTMGHILERMFFNWAKENGFEPEEGWKKDMYLHAMDEMVLVHLSTIPKYQPGENKFIDYFVLPNEEGGLGWLKESKIQPFKKKIWDIFCS